MPELPEVNNAQQYLEATGLQQKIARVEVYDDYIIRNMDGEPFAEKLKGKTFTGTYRRGKFLFGKLDNGHCVQLHLGMSGRFNYYQDEEDQGEYERFVFCFDNGYRLGFRM